jgi:Mn2+/Fe2+ NRAMP family transporter
MIVAATAIGSSHIVLAPVAGARYGYALIWLVLFSHFFKYPAFEFAARFAVGTRSSLIRGYYAVPGPAHWALVLFLVTTLLQGLTILSGVLAVTASILVVSVGVLPFPAWMVIIGLTVIVLHRTGRYGALQVGSKIMLAILVAGTLVAFVFALPRPSDLGRIFVPTLPPGSILLVASILGLMPTGINVSIWHSLWAVEHLPRWEARSADRAGVLRQSRFDLGLGYWASALLAIVFISLGASLLQPRGLVPDGIQVALTISRIYTELLGPWMFPVFMLTAFSAMFSTVYSVMDGFPRAFSTILRTLFPANAFLARPSNPTYWMFMLVIFAFAVSVNTLIPNPVLMVQLVGMLSLMLAPVLFSLNYYCATRLAPEDVRPSPAMRLWALVGIVFMAGAAGFYVFTQVSR